MAPSTLSKHHDRLRWILALLRDDLTNRFILADDHPSEFTLLDMSKILENAAAAIERRHQRYLQGRGR